MDLAKPSGVTIEEHVQNLNSEAEQLLSVRPNTIKKYRAMFGLDLVELLNSSIMWHDEGKRDPRWQAPCRADYNDYVLGGKVGRPKGLRLMKAGIRHELASLETLAKKGVSLSPTEYVAIAAHHGMLSYKHKRRWSDFRVFKQMWDKFEGLSNNSCQTRPHENGATEEFFRLRCKFAGPRSLLQLADRRASARESGDKKEVLRKFEYRFEHFDGNGNPSLRGVQLAVKQFSDEPFAILRAPTGSGKTDAALLWAQHQINSGRADRVVIAMPTRFTAGALSMNVGGSWSKTGLYHSSSFLTQSDDEQEMARLLEIPITVTTIDHLCIALTGTREDHHSIFFNMSNSCVVIDEADFYDDFTQRNIVVLLKALRVLQVPVLLMSATVPDSAVELYGQAGFGNIQVYTDVSSEGIAEGNRVRCVLKNRGENSHPDEIADILQEGLEGTPLIIYANTVRRAQSYRRWFLERGCAFPVVLYHSRYTEPDKARKEDKLLKMLGPETWFDGKKATGIAILTQIGELSVNISADVMISDLCPVDRLAQRVGRLCRFNQSAGRLYLVEPARNKDGVMTTAPAPYGRWRSKIGWEPTAAYTESKRNLRDGEYTANDFVDLVNLIYPTVQELSSRSATNVRKLEECIRYNWLICPAVQSDIDDDNTDSWSSRDIPAQATVYADCTFTGFDNDQASNFSNWRDFRRFELQHRVQCHKYEFRKALENGCLEPVSFCISSNSGDEVAIESAYAVRREFYDFGQGLHFELDDGD